MISRLSTQYISSSYQSLLQISSSAELFDGSGTPVSYIDIAVNTASSSYSSLTATSASHATTSNTSTSSSYSINSTTASYAENSASSSFATTASYVIGGGGAGSTTASYFEGVGYSVSSSGILLSDVYTSSFNVSTVTTPVLSITKYGIDLPASGGLGGTISTAGNIKASSIVTQTVVPDITAQLVSSFSSYSSIVGTAANRFAANLNAGGSVVAVTTNSGSSWSTDYSFTSSLVWYNRDLGYDLMIGSGFITGSGAIMPIEVGLSFTSGIAVSGGYIAGGNDGHLYRYHQGTSDFDRFTGYSGSVHMTATNDWVVGDHVVTSTIASSSVSIDLWTPDLLTRIGHSTIDLVPYNITTPTLAIWSNNILYVFGSTRDMAVLNVEITDDGFFTPTGLGSISVTSTKHSAYYPVRCAVEVNSIIYALGDVGTVTAIELLNGSNIKPQIRSISIDYGTAGNPYQVDFKHILPGVTPIIVGKSSNTYYFNKVSISDLTLSGNTTISAGYNKLAVTADGIKITGSMALSGSSQITGNLSVSGTITGKINSIDVSPTSTVIGYGAGIGIYNTIYGSGAGASLTNGSDNNLFGYNAGYSITTGIQNIMIGDYAGRNTNGNGNVYIGTETGKANLGSTNTMIGHQTGMLSSGDSCVYIGNQVGSSEIGSNRLIIGNASTSKLIDGNFSTNQLTISGTLNVTQSLNVANIVSASAFIGDGSGLTNLPGGNGATINTLIWTGSVSLIVTGSTQTTVTGPLFNLPSSSIVTSVYLGIAGNATGSFNNSNVVIGKKISTNYVWTNNAIHALATRTLMHTASFHTGFYSNYTLYDDGVSRYNTEDDDVYLKLTNNVITSPDTFNLTLIVKYI